MCQFEGALNWPKNLITKPYQMVNAKNFVCAYELWEAFFFFYRVQLLFNYKVRWSNKIRSTKIRVTSHFDGYYCCVFVHFAPLQMINDANRLIYQLSCTFVAIAWQLSLPHVFPGVWSIDWSVCVCVCVIIVNK